MLKDKIFRKKEKKWVMFFNKIFIFKKKNSAINDLNISYGLKNLKRID